MCGRYALIANLDDIAKFFNGQPAHKGLWTWEPNWNMAPAITAPIIALNGHGKRCIVPMRWGLHPHWKKSMPEGKPLFNARIETAFEKPSFRTPWRRRRALVPMSGWYEWVKDYENSSENTGGSKTPYYISPKNQPLSCFAGLWDQYHVDEGITLLSFTILTMPAIGDIKHIHHRMPVRLPKSEWQNWLNPDVKPERIMTHKLASDDLIWHEVSRAVNSGSAQGANLILPTVD